MLLACWNLQLFWDLVIDFFFPFFPLFFLLLVGPSKWQLWIVVVITIIFLLYFYYTFYREFLNSNSFVVLPIEVGSNIDREAEYKTVSVTFQQDSGSIYLKYYTSYEAHTSLENLVQSDPLFRDLRNGFHLLSYLSSSQKNVLFLFREVIYLIIIVFTLSMDLPKKLFELSSPVDLPFVIAALVFYIVVIFLSLAFKAHLVAFRLDRFLRLLDYIRNRSRYRFTSFYIHPFLLELLNDYFNKGIGAVISRALRHYLPR